MPSILQSDIDSETEAVRIRLRDKRLLMGWTLDEAAKRAGLSKSFLSRLEEGSRQPSIGALLSLARAYGIAVASLFEPKSDSDTCTVIRGASMAVRQTNGLLYSTLSCKSRPTNLQALRITVGPDRIGDEQYRHDDEEWLYVLTGKLRLILGTDSHSLEAGDAAHFDARIPHRLVAEGDRDVDLILVACAAPRQGTSLM